MVEVAVVMVGPEIVVRVAASGLEKVNTFSIYAMFYDTCMYNIR